jgi:hypothetical protein
MTARRILAGVALLAMVLIPSAFAGRAILSASGTITGPGSDGYVSLVVTNTGDDEILCFRISVPTSVKVVSARPPQGWQLVSSVPPPSPDIGARLRGTTGLPPGGEVRLAFRTDPPYPVNGLATLVVSASETCSPTTRSTVTGPPPMTPKKCKCTKMSVKLDPALLQEKRLPRAKQDFGVGFTWTMTCDAGTGGCQGRILFLPPEVLAGLLPEPRGNFRLNLRRATITCNGQCARTQPGRFEVKMRSSRQLNELFGRTLAFQVRLFCVADGQLVPKGTRTVRVRVDQTGRVRQL